MLAEPKRRTVWSLNPRGKHWSEDKTKFGQKMLESMGWREGHGLGKDKNGITEHIKVNVNIDNKGLGYKPSADEVWIDKNNDYEQLLTELAEHHNSGRREERVSNLEEVSKRMKNRVHYHKLIKSKNLSQCSEKDLNSIFPKKQKLKKTSNNSVIETKSTENQFESNKSIDDYFRTKLMKLNIKSELLNKFISNSKDNTIDNECQQIDEENKVLTEEDSGLPEENNGLTEENNSLSEDHNSSEVIDIKSNEFEGNGDNCETDSITKSIDSNITESKRKKPKKSKRKIEEVLNGSETELIVESNEQNLPKTGKSKKSKKCKKLKKESIDRNEDKCETQSETSCETISEPKVTAEKTYKSDDLTMKFFTKIEKNINKFNLKIPKGYQKHTLSVSESLHKYHKISMAIMKDKALNTTNLMSLKGYGCHTD